MNPRLFEEIQIVGSRKIVKRIEAKLFPEMLFVHDLVVNFADMADEIDENDYMEMAGGNN